MADEQTPEAVDETSSPAAVDDDARSRPPDVFAGDAGQGVEPFEPDDPPALEGKTAEVRYSGEFDEVEVRLPNGALGHVKRGGYLKTTVEHAKQLAEQDTWHVKGGRD